MDEVFDLKERNQWLRRNIKNLLQQLIRATYGDTINRYHFFKKKQQKTTKSWSYLAFKVLLLEVDYPNFCSRISFCGPLKNVIEAFYCSQR